MYRIIIDKKACDGIFACLVRDDRFTEGEDGLATVDPDHAETVEQDETRVVATVDDDRIEDARQAAAACPPNAITIEEIDSHGGTRPTDDEEVTELCR
jgi:ferredoxin